MTLHVGALYIHDATGQIVRVNEHDGAPAPRFFVGATASGLVRRYRRDVDDTIRHQLEEASADHPLLGSEAEPAAHLAQYAEILSRSAPVQRTEAGPAFRFPEQLPASSSAAVLVSEANIGLLHPLLEEWIPDVRRSAPLVALALDGRAVAVCGSVRITPQAHEAGVETAAAFRGRGLASQVVAAWARAVRARNAAPFYSTSWRNEASQAVARKLALVQFGNDLHLT